MNTKNMTTEFIDMTTGAGKELTSHIDIGFIRKRISF